MRQRTSSVGSGMLAFVCAAALAACAQKPTVVASACDKAKGCGQAQPLRQLDKVNILLVVNNSSSVADKQEAFKRELPRMLNAITGGEGGGMSFPPAQSVHVAVVTSDMGIGKLAPFQGINNCVGVGMDGFFVSPSEQNVEGCDVAHPSYLSFDGGSAAIATVDAVACVPVVGTGGCGFEMPLEAMLKALWRNSDASVAFLSGVGHGADENAGFLREDSLLVAVVITDEDDCSAADPAIFTLPQSLDPEVLQNLELRCQLNPGGLYPVQRYADAFRALRPHNDNVIFASIAGIPPDLIPSDGKPDYEALLADPRMQFVIEQSSDTDPIAHARPSCRASANAVSPFASAIPAPRLVEVTQSFGADGVLASICADDFGDTAGMLIHVIGARLAAFADGHDADAGR